MKAFVLLVLLALTFSFQHFGVLGEIPLHRSAAFSQFREQLDQVQTLFLQSKKLTAQHGLGDRSIECGLCAIVVNAIEGYLAENLTLQEIETLLQKDVCSWFSGDAETFCDSLVQLLPQVVEDLNNAVPVSQVCTNGGFCDLPFVNQPDQVDIPKFIINLDLPPIQRWKSICSIPQYQDLLHWLVNKVSSVFPDNGILLASIGKALLAFFPQELADEIKGCAAMTDVSEGWLAFMNLGYELSDLCTSIVAETPNGQIYHARNLDFGEGMGFTDTMRNASIEVEAQSGGKTVFRWSTFPGFVGVLSGIKPQGFSVTVNTRFYPGGIGDFFYEIIAALEEKNASLVSFLNRQVVQNENTFNDALNALSKTELIADVYYIIAGISHNQGAVISRNRQNATDIWRLNSPSTWFLAQTNYDHWKEVPWFDNRRKPAMDGMNQMGQQQLSLSGMLNVLTTKPVLNLQTVYTILSYPAQGSYKTLGRYCNFPCPE